MVHLSTFQFRMASEVKESINTYGQFLLERGRMLSDYFPEARRERVIDQSVHFDQFGYHQGDRMLQSARPKLLNSNPMPATEKILTA
jgi:hypothetical protein